MRDGRSASTKSRAWSIAPGEAPAKTDEAPQPAAVDAPRSHETLAVFDKWLRLPNKTPIYAALGTVAANLLPGDPVWLGIIGPPSSAKTEILNATARLPKVVQAATLTVAGLLSRHAEKTARQGRARRTAAADRRLRLPRAERLRLDPVDAHRDAGPRCWPRCAKSTTAPGPGMSAATAAARSLGRARSGCCSRPPA